jgi:hypothetical protein
MTLISIITLLVSIALLIALYYHEKDLKEDFEFFWTYGEHLYNPQNLKKRGKILFWVADYNFYLALLNLLYLFFKQTLA